MRKMARGVTEDIIEMLLEDHRVLEDVICTDCPVCSRIEGCPVDYDFFHRLCPQKAFVERLCSSVEATLAEYGIR